ncbi:MAG: hypothetical protein MHM6MM_008309 [Cercozoa sp. M6MM]
MKRETSKFNTSSEQTLLQIEGEWYDLTQWKHCHPGGAEILDTLQGQDCTDVFTSLHSKEAFERLQRLKKVPKEKAPSLHDAPDHVKAFREFREQLVKDGYFDRSLPLDLFYVLHPFVLAYVAYWLATQDFTGAWALSSFVLGLAMTQSGWVGHDYQHGRGGFCSTVAPFVSGLLNAFDARWWSRKHNGAHHAFVNVHDLDVDIQLEPVFFLLQPREDDKDHWLRRWQHVYFVPVVSLLYWSWRWQSLQSMLLHRQWVAILMAAINYASMLLFFPWLVFVASVFIGGFLVGIIVTASHQAEPITHSSSVEAYDFVKLTFVGTRNAKTRCFVDEWLWGGMQYQLEHHLFPTMPKFRYASVAPLVRRWAQQHGLEYKCDDAFDLIRRNYNHISHVASSDGKPHLH